MDLNTALDLIARQSKTIDQLLHDLKVERERNGKLQDMVSNTWVMPMPQDYTRTEPKLSGQREIQQNVEVGG